MNILITGGSGFLGRALTKNLIKAGEIVTWASRQEKTQHPNNVDIITYEEFVSSDRNFDIIINLAGAGVADRHWSEARKKVLYDSRLKPTQAILDYIEQASIKPKMLISGSAIGWYGTQDDKILTEKSEPHDEFTHQLCDKWEKLAMQAESLGIPTIIIRTGLVMSSDGGMVKRLLLPFSLGLGGKLGDGSQIMSWISKDDWTSAVQFIINKHRTDSEASRLYNLTAPRPITNDEFTRSLGKHLKRPTFFRQPRALISAIFGELSVLLLDGQTVVPQALLDEGFTFSQSTIEEAL